MRYGRIEYRVLRLVRGHQPQYHRGSPGGRPGTDRGNQDMGLTGCLQFGHDIGEVRFEPLFGCVTSALIAEHPALRSETSAACNLGGGFFEVVDIIRLIFNNTFGHTMRCQQYRNRSADILWQFCKGLCDTICYGLQEIGL